jgi:hypothetical protein
MNEISWRIFIWLMVFESDGNELLLTGEELSITQRKTQAFRLRREALYLIY